MCFSFNMDDEQKFTNLIAKAKKLVNSDSQPNELRKGIAYYKQAYEIHQSEKLKKRITKLEASYFIFLVLTTSCYRKTRWCNNIVECFIGQKSDNVLMATVVA